MGFLKKIAKKISNAIASLKSSGAQKILKKACHWYSAAMRIVFCGKNR